MLMIDAASYAMCVLRVLTHDSNDDVERSLHHDGHGYIPPYPQGL